MRIVFLINLVLLLTVILSASTEGFFFEYPKKYIMEIFQSLKEKKEAKKKPVVHNIKHYHVHYHPSEVHLVSEAIHHAPSEYELDHIHREKLDSLGWSDWEYKYTPEPKISVSSLYKSWSNIHVPLFWSKDSLETSISKKIDTENHGILLRVPIQRQAIVHQEESNKKSKASLLEKLLKKLDEMKNSWDTGGK